MKKYYWIVYLYFLFNLPIISATDIDSSYSLKWNNIPWGSGGLEPAGPPWNMVGPFDFDNDGYGDFIVSSSYTGQFCNDIVHYEAMDDDSIDYQWVYTFSDLSCEFDNYSSVAVGDIDNDQNPEILALTDTRPGVSDQAGLQIFEWNPITLSFPDVPTATWNMLLDSVWEAGQILVEDLDNDNKQEIIVSIMDGPWGETGSSQLMIFELENSDLENPIWNIEYIDPLTTNWSGYNITVGDLDLDGLKEIYIVAYEYYHLIVYENIGIPDEYDYQTDFYVTNEVSERANQSIVIIDIDNNGTNEMFAATSGTNSLTGTLLTPGYFYAVKCTTGVDSLTFADFSLLATYSGGIRQINSGDADQDGKPNIYIAGHYEEAVYDWEYNGGDINSIDSYTERIIFQDDTLDNFTTSGTIVAQDQGKVRVAKLFPGDIDNDGNGDLIIASASFASDKPQLFMIEHSDETDALNNDQDNSSIIAEKINLNQNYPNPFNPSTAFQYNIPESGLIELTITDVLGRKVITLLDGYQRSGKHNVLWTGKDAYGNQVPSGVYFYNLKYGSKIISKKMTLSK